MGSSPKLVCNVKFADGNTPDGVYANAFRVVRGDGRNCFLDFLIYLSDDNEASVVARVSIDRGFLPAIRDRLTETLKEIHTGEDSEIFDAFVLGMSRSVN